jgi:hypothetical protein
MGLFRRSPKVERLHGFAEIVETWKPPQHGAMGNCKMKLRLDVPGIEPQVVSHHEWNMRPNRWPEEGMRVAVTVDPGDLDDVDVDWDSVFGAVMGGKAGVGVEMLSMAVGLDLDLSKGTGDDQGGEVAPDFEARIAALNAQHAAGQITYEEMSAEIMKVMGITGTEGA